MLLLAAGMLLTACTHLDPRADEPTALDKYVAATDPNYSYRLINTIPGEGHTAYVLEMTSQSWLTSNEVNRTLWKHWMVIIQPDTVTTSKALLFISGGSNES